MSTSKYFWNTCFVSGPLLHLYRPTIIILSKKHPIRKNVCRQPINDRTHTHTRTHTVTKTQTDTKKYSYMLIHTHTDVCTFTNTYIGKCTHTHTHYSMHAHTRTHPHMCVSILLQLISRTCAT